LTVELTAADVLFEPLEAFEVLETERLTLMCSGGTWTTSEMPFATVDALCGSLTNPTASLTCIVMLPATFSTVTSPGCDGPEELEDEFEGELEEEELLEEELVTVPDDGPAVELGAAVELAVGPAVALGVAVELGLDPDDVLAVALDVLAVALGATVELPTVALDVLVASVELPTVALDALVAFVELVVLVDALEALSLRASAGSFQCTRCAARDWLVA